MKSTVRVLMAVPHYPYPVAGGLERQSHELGKALLELGVGVQALSYRFDELQDVREIVEGIQVHRIPWSSKKTVRFIRAPFDLLSMLFRLRRSYDIVHLHQYSWFGAFLILAVKIIRKPVLIKLSTVGSRSLPGVAQSRLGSIKLAIFKRADAVIAMTKESILELNAICYPKERVLTTPNGIRMVDVSTTAHQDSSACPVCRVVFVGRISPEKRIDDLLRAWKRVVDSTRHTVKLELWGNGPAEADMKALSNDLGVDESVIFRGHVDDVRDKLEKMDIFVLTSNREGNSNAVLEAMAAGLPVVSTRVGGTPMQVGKAGASWLIDPGDTEGLFDRLTKLIENDALRARVGESMRERIRDHFEIRHIATTYAAAYKLLAAGKRDEVSGVGDPVILG